MRMFTRRERERCACSLVSLLQALAGRRTTVDLRNGISVTGIVVNVDSNMNTTLKDAETVKLDGEKVVLDELTVRGAQIRYVHIPGDINVKAAIQKQVRELVGGGDRRREMSRGTKQRHLEERKLAREFRLGRGRGSECQEKGGMELLREKSEEAGHKEQSVEQ